MTTDYTEMVEMLSMYTNDARIGLDAVEGQLEGTGEDCIAYDA
jgi:hypothetical protein